MWRPGLLKKYSASGFAEAFGISAPAPDLSACLSRHEDQALEQVHVLLVLEQGAVQRRDDGLAVLRAQRVGRDVLGEEELQPVEELRGRGLLLQARDLAHLEED